MKTSSNLDLYKEIVDSTSEVFTSMLGVELGSSQVENLDSTEVKPDVSSVLGLGGDIKGMVEIHCPGQVAQKITGLLLGMDIDELNEDVEDAIGEIANMVAGNLKTSFAETDIDVQLAIPITVAGKYYRTSGLSEAERMSVVFDLDDGGKFLVELKYVLSDSGKITPS